MAIGIKSRCKWKPAGDALADHGKRLVCFPERTRVFFEI